MDHHQASVCSFSALLNQSADTDEDKSDILDHSEDRKVSDTDSQTESSPDNTEPCVEQPEVDSPTENGTIKTNAPETSSVRSSISQINNVTDPTQLSECTDEHHHNHVRFAGETEVVNLSFEMDSVTSENGPVSPKNNDMTSSQGSASKQKKRFREIKTKTFIAFLFVFIVCGVTLIYHLYHLKLQRLMRGKKLVYNIDVSDVTFYNRRHDKVLKGVLGVGLRLEKFPHYCDKQYKSNLHGDIYEELCLTWADLADLKVTYNTTEPVTCYEVSWQSLSADVVLEDCFDLQEAHWYGMGLVYDQPWPIDSHSVGRIPFLAGTVYDLQSLGPVLQPYWLSSRGVSIIVDPSVPLHVSFNSPSGDNASSAATDGRLCLYADFDDTPYAGAGAGHPHLKYSICVGDNVAAVHNVSVDRFSSPPLTPPDMSIVYSPLWSTLPYLRDNLSQTAVQDYYQNVVDGGYRHSSFLLDGAWQETVGELVFSPALFPDPAAMVRDVKQSSFRLLLGTDPYLSYNSKAFRDAVGRDLLVRSGVVPGLTRWWLGEPSTPDWYRVAGVLDMFPEAQLWLADRLANFSQTYGVDGFYWKGGQMDVQPYFPRFRANLSSPNEYLLKMAELGDSLGLINIQQSAFTSQHVPMWLRLYGRQSTWDTDNGLHTVIPSMLTLSLLGYPFLLPDVIGGHAYGTWPSKELYIRWMELTAFLPVMHFSIPPDHYDNETVQIAKDMMDLHATYVAPLVRKLARESLSSRLMIIRPLWMIAPEEPDVLAIDDQFMVGDSVMVAPVIKEGQTERNIFLPSGIWYNKLHSNFIQGPRWLHDFPVPLDKIAHFERKPFYS